ncbi:MAG: endonuclease Q family protein [Eubacteriales bacterium]|nr:endonuclease Q family protein [Eubacteriales bacterium]
MYIADLHIHSHHARATSRESDLPHLVWWAQRKGIGLLGTGDCTHPAWRAALRAQLEPAGEGVYALRPAYRLACATPGDAPRLVVTGEVDTVYRRDGRSRRVHHLLVLPDLDAADALAARLAPYGDLCADGRPTLRLDSRDLLALLLTVSPAAMLIPAHIWTPHYGLLGAATGFDSLAACFGDLAPAIRAVETGLSADPPMLWRVSALDGLTLLSHSDAHAPSKLGREADLLTGARDYPALRRALCTGAGLAGTIEFFPAASKYHQDGHRRCGVCLSPAQADAHGGRCPVCGKPLTIGVAHRVAQLADRPAGYRPPDAKPFERLLPLSAVVAAALGVSEAAKRTRTLCDRLLDELGSAFYILRRAPLADVRAVAGEGVATALGRLRAGDVPCRPGYDGRFGAVELLTPDEIAALRG